ncbi:FAD:protein FMN transferase [Wenyingzhuangia aestuarii]|uniref:FAD:protein FMN transferase n=1 Tax=Wenyingzhuangia aestuarii TaxID=1647582 RepID=UPI00143BCF18|nr:FAD:protein FMN transferase [Wenyingzhuangia aestuarii]NJB82118.1 thiamine biosynthesis lipoprotein [Wenyingzhuangia aestuarii]
MHVTNSFKLLKTHLFRICIFFSIISCEQKQAEYLKLQGNVFGTTFHIKYSDNNNQNLGQSIDSLFKTINNSLSTYHADSKISKINQGLLNAEVDHHFKNVFLLAKEVYQQTNGYFDPTVGKMVNAWGFGPIKIDKQPTNYQVDSLMQYVGFDKITLLASTITKTNSDVYLDFNAIAKGYGVDVVGLFLESKHITDYLVEIGGEIRARGKNAKGDDWSVGIEEPNFDGTRSLQKITHLTNEAIATSGNYRKFRIDEATGKKIAHTLNPKTGFPAETDLLSVSVIAPVSCAEVDAYATAFMAMGFDKAKEIASKFPKMKVFFIYLEHNELKTYASPNLEFKN